MAQRKRSSGDHDHDHDHGHGHHHHHHHHHRHHHYSKIDPNFDPWLHFHISLNDDGSLVRYGQMPSVPATGDLEANSESCPVLSKDVVLDAEKKTSLRIYRPNKLLPSSGNKLPIVFTFHAGGFIVFNLDTSLVHENMNYFSGGIPAVVVSVGFRNAPESRLPAQYEDAVDAINWAKDQAIKQDAGDPWLRDYGDFSRCYLYGKSSGGNIALNAAMLIADMNLAPISVVGLMLNQPLLGGHRRTKSELKYATDPVLPLPCTDLLWELALPLGADRDHRYCNPLKDPDTIEKMKHVGKILVIGFGGDPLVDRQEAFVRKLTMQGIPVDARFDDVGFHCVDTVDPRRAEVILTFLKEFIASD